MEEFVATTESECESYTEDEWKESIKEFGEIVKEYNKAISKYSAEEKMRGVKAFGQYNALVLQYGLAKSRSLLQDFGEAVPSYIEGIESEMPEAVNKLIEGIKDIDVDEYKQDLEEFDDKVNQKVEDIINNLMEDDE